MNMFKTPFTVTLTGHCGSGKSYLIKYIVKSFQQKSFFDFVCVFSRTGAFNGDYSFLSDLGIKNVILSPSELKKTIPKLMNIQKENKQKGIERNVLIIFDDIFGCVKDSSLFQDLISTHRHYNFSIMFSVQYISGSTTYLREITQYACIFEQRSESALKLCYSSYFPEIETFKKFKEYIKDKLPQYHFFFVDRGDNKKNIFVCP